MIVLVHTPVVVVTAMLVTGGMMLGRQASGVDPANGL
jgi:hypothetical protein